MVIGKGLGSASRHAELSVILNISRVLTYGADVYVVRINNFGDLKLSEPCPMCYAACEFVGVKRIFYSIDNDTCGVIKL